MYIWTQCQWTLHHKFPLNALMLKFCVWHYFLHVHVSPMATGDDDDDRTSHNSTWIMASANNQHQIQLPIRCIKCCVCVSVPCIFYCTSAIKSRIQLFVVLQNVLKSTVSILATTRTALWTDTWRICTQVKLQSMMVVKNIIKNVENWMNERWTGKDEETQRHGGGHGSAKFMRWKSYFVAANKMQKPKMKPIRVKWTGPTSDTLVRSSIREYYIWLLRESGANHRRLSTEMLTLGDGGVGVKRKKLVEKQFLSCAKVGFPSFTTLFGSSKHHQRRCND